MRRCVPKLMWMELGNASVLAPASKHLSDTRLPQCPLLSEPDVGDDASPCFNLSRI